MANNPGNPEQDAFNGSLDSCRIINSHKFPTLMTLVVDGATSGASSPSSRYGRDPEEWRLASGDPRDTAASKYRLHTMDVYFWAQDDAKLVVDNLKHLLQPAQLDVVELEPEPESEQEPEPVQHSMRHEAPSPLVQNLENMAISDPAYQNGQTRNSQNVPQAVNLPPPPPQPAQTLSPPTAVPHAASPQAPPQNFAPMAYNPAAPAAPEPIAHREDTPPPPDDGHGTGLAAAAMHDQTAYQPGLGAHHSQATGQPYQPGQPQGQPYQPGQPSGVSWTGAPPSATQQRYGSPYTSPPQSTPLSFSGPPTAASPNTASTSVPSRHGSTAAANYVPDAHSQMYQPSAQTAAQTPGSQFYDTLPPSTSPHKPLQHIQPQYMDYLSTGAPASAGYSNFNYGAASQQGMLQKQQAAGGGSQYDVHSQVYRPTEHEATAYQKESGSGKRNSHGGKPTSGAKLEKNENKVNRFMKKMEHKIGL